jgi:hypothetical protein
MKKYELAIELDLLDKAIRHLCKDFSGRIPDKWNDSKYGPIYELLMTGKKRST